VKDPHIENPIPDDEWACPLCGNKDDFWIERVYDCGDPRCEKNHAQDIVVCFKCKKSWSLQTIIKMWVKKKNMVKCPCCKGTGWIEGPKEEKDGLNK
jgi:hypothetical protein